MFILTAQQAEMALGPTFLFVNLFLVVKGKMLRGEKSSFTHEQKCIFKDISS